MNIRKNFTKAELSSPDDGSFVEHPKALDALQAMRDALGPLVVFSATRSPAHNKAVGGAPDSLHMRGMAFDLRLDYPVGLMVRRAHEAGFRGFGFYKNFLHVDVGPARHWLG